MALDVDPTTATGRWWRHVPAGVDPLRRPSPPSDNRWQRGSLVDALYLAEDEACVWAEWYRHLAEAAVPPARALPRPTSLLLVVFLPGGELHDQVVPIVLTQVGDAPVPPMGMKT